MGPTVTGAENHKGEGPKPKIITGISIGMGIVFGIGIGIWKQTFGKMWNKCVDSLEKWLGVKISFITHNNYDEFFTQYASL